MPLKVGGGKLKISLYNALPSYSIEELMDICERFAKER